MICIPQVGWIHIGTGLMSRMKKYLVKARCITQSVSEAALSKVIQSHFALPILVQELGVAEYVFRPLKIRLIMWLHFLPPPLMSHRGSAPFEKIT